MQIHVIKSWGEWHKSMTPLEQHLQDTRKHIVRVRELIDHVIENLNSRAVFHDDSKLHEPEASIFAEYRAKLRDSTYLSDEYNENLKHMQVAIDHHYANNRHHPQFYADGINGMSLLDLIEMLADWKAAGEQHSDGDMVASLTKNQERFGIGEQLFGILVNTAREMRWFIGCT